LRGPFIDRNPNARDYSVVVLYGIGRGGGLSLRTRVCLYHQSVFGPGVLAEDEG